MTDGGAEDDRITRGPEVLPGEPAVRGTRIPAEHVIGLPAGAAPVDGIRGSHPHLAAEDVAARPRHAHRRVQAERARSGVA